jgi:phosphoribosyl 1,2-cyclic phosphodiesterase
VHNSHLNLEKAIFYAEQIQAQNVGLIHLGHELEHQQLSDELKQRQLAHIQPLFDGQILYY